MLLVEITPQDCRDYRHKQLHAKKKNDQNRSASTVNRAMSRLSKIFLMACEEERIERSPMQFVKRLEEPPPRKDLLTSEQKAALWRELDKDPFLWRIVTLGVNLPLRRGQILFIKRGRRF